MVMHADQLTKVRYADEQMLIGVRCSKSAVVNVLGHRTREVVNLSADHFLFRKLRALEFPCLELLAVRRSSVQEVFLEIVIS